MPPAKALHPISRQALPAHLFSVCVYFCIFTSHLFRVFFSFVLSLYHFICFSFIHLSHLLIVLPCHPLYFEQFFFFFLYYLFLSPPSLSNYSFFSYPVLLHSSFLLSFPLPLLSSACCCSLPHLPLLGPCQPMPAAQGTLSPLLPTAEVSEMGTDVAVMPCGDRGYGMQVCVISVCVCICTYLCLCVSQLGVMCFNCSSWLLICVYVCWSVSWPALTHWPHSALYCV